MKHKVKVQLDGQEREIEIDIDPKALNLVPREEVERDFIPKATFEPEMDARIKRAIKGMVKLEEIPTNAELKQKVFELLGVKLTNDGKPQVTVDQLQELEQNWRKRELEPVLEREKMTQSRVQRLLQEQLTNEVLMAAAEARVHDHLRTPVRSGADAPIVAMMKDLFGYSDEHQRHFVRKGDGFELSTKAHETGMPYMTPREFVLSWATKKENAPYINAVKPGGANLAGTPGAGGSGVATLEAPSDRPLTLQEYQAAQQAAGEGGRVVVKSGEPA